MRPARALDGQQRWLLRAITASRAPADLSRLGCGAGAVVGLGVYRHAYRARLVECLEDDFPALRSLLGAEAFVRLAGRVIDRDPPSEPTLNRYGRRLAALLRREPRATVHGTLARDLARLEWALVEAIHAPLAPALDPARLAALPPPAWAGLRLIAAPSLRLVASAFPIDGCYRQHLRGEAVTAPARDPEVVAVVRRGDGLHRRIFAPAAGRLLGSLARGRTLGSALAACPLAPAAVREVLAIALAHGCFAAIRTESP